MVFSDLFGKHLQVEVILDPLPISRS